MELSKVSIILPSYKPDDKMVSAVIDLRAAGFEDIVVVDDGGGEEYNCYFDKVREMGGCTVLVHPQNRGKGAALKTALCWYLENRPGGLGVITVDGDGQHRPEDVKACAERLVEKKEVVLGVRDFTQPDVPPRSAFGNKISCGVFRVLVGMKISDTQTGLRAIPTEYIEGMCHVDGDRYEYETNVLLHMKKNKIPYGEVKIKTVYIDDNESSHFRPVRDSIRIYSLIFKYLFTSTFFLFFASAMLCYVIDWALFTGFNVTLSMIFEGLAVTSCSYAGARIISSLLNFYLNRRIFNKGSAVLSSMVKYYLLVAFNLLVGSLCVYFISKGLLQIDAVEAFAEGVSSETASSVVESCVKLPVDVIMYIFNYTIQKRFVFKNK